MSEPKEKTKKNVEHHQRYRQRMMAARDVALTLATRVEALESQQALLTDLLTKVLGKSLSAPDKQHAA